MLQRVCVFCGSSPGTAGEYRQVAVELGGELARRGLRLVYGGGRVGLMGALADAVLAAGGQVTGVIPEALLAREVGHAGLTELHVVDSMHERKALMAEMADAFVALPGGFGTCEEFCEVLTWSQLGIHEKPCALLNVRGFFDPLLAFFDRATAEGFLRPEHRSMLLPAAHPAELFHLLSTWQPPQVEKWLNPAES